jgi:hypothetical protein
MMMTEFCIELWLSNGMIFVIDQVSLIHRLHIVWGYTFVHYNSTFTNVAIITFWEVIEWTFWCLPYVSIILWMVSKRGNTKQRFPVLICFTSCGRFEYWIEGVWVNNRVVVLGAHTVTRCCWLVHCRSANQASPRLYDIDLSHKIHFWVCYQDSGWLTLSAKWNA